MAIAFNCTSCGKSFQVADEMAGRAVKCAACGTKLIIPGKAEAASEAAPNLGLDWNLMEQAAKVEEPKSANKKKLEAGAVDWDAIAQPISVELAKGKSTKFDLPAEDRPLGSAFNPTRDSPDARNNRYKSGRLDYFLVDSFMSLPAGLAYLPQIFMIIMIGFGVSIVVGTMGAVTSWVMAKMPDFSPMTLVITLLVIVLLPLLCFYGYIMRFWMQISDNVSQDNAASDLPDLSVGGMLQSLFLSLLFVSAFVLPIVTLPLAPLAFLAMGRANSFQAFRLSWLVRSAMRTPVFILIVLCYIPVFLFMMMLTAYWVFPPVARFIISITKELPPVGQDFLSRVVIILTLVPLMMMFGASICRLVGLLGKYNPIIYVSLPKRGNVFEAMGVALVGLLLAFFVVYPAIGSLSNDGLNRLARQFSTQRVASHELLDRAEKEQK